MPLFKVKVSAPSIRSPHAYVGVREILWGVRVVSNLVLGVHAYQYVF